MLKAEIAEKCKHPIPFSNNTLHSTRFAVHSVDWKTFFEYWLKCFRCFKVPFLLLPQLYNGTWTNGRGTLPETLQTWGQFGEIFDILNFGSLTMRPIVVAVPWFQIMQRQLTLEEINTGKHFEHYQDLKNILLHTFIVFYLLIWCLRLLSGCLSSCKGRALQQMVMMGLAKIRQTIQMEMIYWTWLDVWLNVGEPDETTCICMGWIISKIHVIMCEPLWVTHWK